MPGIIWIMFAVFYKLFQLRLACDLLSIYMESYSPFHKTTTLDVFKILSPEVCKYSSAFDIILWVLFYPQLFALSIARFNFTNNPGYISGFLCLLYAALSAYNMQLFLYSRENVHDMNIKYLDSYTSAAGKEKGMNHLSLFYHSRNLMFY